MMSLLRWVWSECLYLNEVCVDGPYGDGCVAARGEETTTGEREIGRRGGEGEGDREERGERGEGGRGSIRGTFLLEVSTYTLQ